MSLGSGDVVNRTGRANWIRVFKLVLGVLVLVALTRHVVSTWNELRSRGETFRLDFAWLAAAVLLYIVGLSVYGIWFHRVMAASATPIGLGAALRAYLISHLGKYVPGKALVVVMRASIASSAGARPASAVFASLYETLVMMAAGASVAALGYRLSPLRVAPIDLGRFGTYSISLTALGAVLAVAFLLLALPPVFPRLAAVASATLRGAGAGAVPHLSIRLLLEGLTLSAVGWIFLGGSQYAVLRALGIDGIGPGRMPVVVASVALATVAGFVVAVAPGGLGVREWVLWTSLGVLIDHEQAVVAALVLRFCWLVGELLAAALCLGPALGGGRFDGGGQSAILSPTDPDPVGPGISP